MNRLVLVLLLLITGCIQPTDGVAPSPNGPTKPVAASTIEQLAYDASQQRDAIGAKLLTELADEIKSEVARGEPIHDKWLMDRITEANTKAAATAGAKLSAELAKTLNGGDRLDPVKAEKTIRGMAAGRMRASR